jgi:spore germination protein KB
MKNQVKVSQVALILLVIIPGGKYLSLPAVMSQHAGRDSWFAIALLLLIDFLCFMAVLWAVKLNKNNLSLLTILDKSITKVGSKVVFAVMFLFSSARYVVLSCSGYDLINVTFAVNINWPVYAILVAAFTVFLVSRGFQTVGRVAQLMVGIVMLALLIIVISPLRSIEMDNLFPFLEDGFMPVLKAVDHDHFWFTDYLFVYFIMD